MLLFDGEFEFEALFSGGAEFLDWADEAFRVAGEADGGA